MSAPQKQVPAMFIGEHPALDFLNSLAAPKGTVIDWLDTGAELLDWFVQAGLCRETDVAHLRDQRHASALTQALGEIHAFRDEFRTFIAATAGHTEGSPTTPIIAKINQHLARGRQHLQIAASETSPTQTGALSLATHHQFTSPADLLPRLAAACAQLICEANFHYIRNCEGPACTLYFLDVSKNHKRRWCSMEVCGNRAKAAAHRRARRS